MGLIELMVILGLIGLNGICSGYEIALASISKARLQLLLRESRPGAKAALYMKQNIEASLATMQIAITLVGAIAAAVGGSSAEEVIMPVLRNSFGVSHTVASSIAIAIVVLPLTFVTIMLGELIPKVFSMRHSEWVCLRLSPWMQWCSFVARPAVWLFETAVRNMMSWGERHLGAVVEGKHLEEASELFELRAHAAYARASHLIGEKEESMIIGTARLASRMVRDVMLPAEHISMLNTTTSLGDSLIAAHLDMHTRFPVTERPNDPQAIIGYVNFKDLVALLRLSRPFEASLKAVLRPLPNIRDNLPLAACLERLIVEHTHIALVRDAANKIVGLVSLEDILEEVVGDIEDEYDRLPVHAVQAGWAWVVGGGLSLSRLAELTGIDLTKEVSQPLPESPQGEMPNTVSSWIIGQLHRPAQGGDILERPDVRIIVRKVRRQKVLEAQIGRISQESK